MKIIFSAFLGLALGIDLQAPTANASSHLPLSRTHIAAFPLKLLADGNNREQTEGIDGEFQIGAGKTKNSLSPGDGGSCSGQAKGGKTWEVKLSDIPLGLGYQLYSGDLDKNGINDLIFVE